MTKLIRTTGISEDSRGCSFHYIRYATKHATGLIDDVRYICREFPEVKTVTLEEMKKIIGEK